VRLVFSATHSVTVGVRPVTAEKPGDKIRVTIVRNGKTMEMTLPVAN
jgi:hypothetical protein